MLEVSPEARRILKARTGERVVGPRANTGEK